MGLLPDVPPAKALEMRTAPGAGRTGLRSHESHHVGNSHHTCAGRPHDVEPSAVRFEHLTTTGGLRQRPDYVLVAEFPNRSQLVVVLGSSPTWSAGGASMVTGLLKSLKNRVASSVPPSFW